MVPVVLVHGLVGTLDDEDVTSRLAPRPVLAPALLGYGPHPAVTGCVILGDQVEHLRQILDDADHPRVHLVGYSAGGVVAILFADQFPDRVESLISVEGNFTLTDAFLSKKLAALTGEQCSQVFATYSADPKRWLAEMGIRPDERREALARRWLEFQPASTVHAMARAILETTAQPDYRASVRDVLGSVPFHLLAGERSRDGWDVPPWAVRQARSFVVLPDTGHFLMLEQPAAFADTLAEMLDA